MAECLILKGGGGTSSDEVTALKQQVLVGTKTITKDSNDEIVEGTMPNRGAWNTRVTNDATKISIPQGHHDGSGYVESWITNLNPGNILSGRNVGGVVGTATNDAVLPPEHLLVGYSGYDDGVKKDGTMPNRGGWVGTVGMNGSVTVPQGHHNGSGKVNGPAVTQRGAWGTNIGVNGRATIPEGYHNGSGSVGQAINSFVGTPKPINNIRLANGRFEVAADEGYYGCNWAGNSYEYMSYAQVRNAIGLSADKIKKGVPIMGIIGTFQGFIPEIQDLYLRGNNVFGFSVGTNVTLTSDRINVNSSGKAMIYAPNKLYTRPGGITRLNIESDVILTGSSASGSTGLWILKNASQSSGTLISSIHYGTNGTFPVGNVQFDISGISSIQDLGIQFIASAGARGNVYRIWVS